MKMHFKLTLHHELAIAETLFYPEIKDRGTIHEGNAGYNGHAC